jgi:oligopeptide transport system permease protein
MTTAPGIILAQPETMAARPDRIYRRALRSGRILWGGGILGFIVLLCLATLPLTLSGGNALYYDEQSPPMARNEPYLSRAAAEQAMNRPAPAEQSLSYRISFWFGADTLGRSLLGRCLLGGAISLLIGLAAATISVVLGVSVGLLAGYRGGWIDAVLMRSVDVLYGLPYVLLIVLFKIALEPALTNKLNLGIQAANLVVLFLAIGLVSWLTMARVVRGQVLSLRSQPFIEACRASGLPEWRIFTRHLLPNLIGPIIVYATLTVPQAILQESFLSFLGIGIQQPMPTWGALASEGLLPSLNTINPRWWLLTFPCVLLAITLLSLNFLGDGLRDIFDPKREAAKI